MLPPPEETLVPIPPDRSLAQLGEVVRRADDYAGRAKAPSTVKAYSASWRDFTTWTDAHARAALPATPETVAPYLAAMAALGAKPATIARRLVVISQAHKAADLPSPTTSSAVRRVHAGIRRTHGTAQKTKARALVGRDACGDCGRPPHHPACLYFHNASEIIVHSWTLHAASRACPAGRQVGPTGRRSAAHRPVDPWYDLCIRTGVHPGRWGSCRR